MGLVRAWRRQAILAWAATLLAPVAILATAVLVGIGGGGLGALGSLGQLITGPERPALERPEAETDQDLLERAATVVASALPQGGTAGAPLAARGPDGRGERARRPVDGQGPRGRIGPRRRRTGPGRPAPGPGGQPGGGGPAPPPRRGGVVEQLSGTAEVVVDQAPAPVAPTVDQLLDTAVGTCGQLPCP